MDHAKSSNLVRWLFISQEKIKIIVLPWEQAEQRKGIEKSALEGVAAGEVDEEVDGGVEDERQVVEAGEAKDPSWGTLHLLLLLLVLVTTAQKMCL